jgi:hypothetical protein
MDKIFKHSWLSDPILGPTKALMGHAGLELIEQNGGSKPRNMFSRDMKKNRMVQIVGDLVPSAIPRLKQVYPDRDYAELIGWRARAAVEGEHERFLRPSFANTIALVSAAWARQKQIHPDDIYGMIERELLIKHGDGPGVYFRRDPENSNRVYVGRSGRVVDRNKGHSNSPLMLAAIFSTQDELTAKYIEDEILLALREHPDKVRGDRGLFIFKPSVDAYALAYSIFEAKRFSRLMFHNRNRVSETISKTEPAMLPMMSAF